MILDEIESVAWMAEDYAHLTGDAACRVDVATLAVRLLQLGLCCNAMIQAYSELEKFREQAGGQDLAEKGNERGGREDQRPGDAVA